MDAVNDEAALRPGAALNPLSAIFGAGMALRNKLYDSGGLEQKRLDWPVISIGNLRAGGSSKTPFVLHLGRLLQEKHVPFTVLSRGYGRKTSTVEVVDPNGEAARYGDEPLLLAKKLRVPVVVAKNRFEAGRIAEQQFSARKSAHEKQWLHLLDDGFQHRKLARDFDIVLLAESDLNDSLLPAGMLREPLSSLHRADAIVIPKDLDSGRLPPYARQKYLWRVNRKLKLPQNLPRQPVAFCAIARPERFFSDLRGAGIVPAAERSWRDHHQFRAADVRELNSLGRQAGADGFVTTEKDLMRLRGFEDLQPLTVVELELQVEDPPSMIATILDTIAERLRTRK